MYWTFCNNLCCLFIAVVFGGMAAGPVHCLKPDEEGSFSAGHMDEAAIESFLMMNQTTLSSFVPSCDSSMETYSASGSAQVPCQMSHRCHILIPGCSLIPPAKAGHLPGNILSSKAGSSLMQDDYIFAIGRIRV